MQKSLTVSWDDLQKFRNLGSSDTINKFWNEIINDIPKKYQEKIKNEKPYLDFQVNIKKDEMKKNCIPYRFKIDIKEINALLEDYTVYVTFN